MSRNSRVVWRAVLKSVSGLPECPQDLNEPQYASLLFERICGVRCPINDEISDTDLPSYTGLQQSTCSRSVLRPASQVLHSLCSREVRMKQPVNGVKLNLSSSMGRGSTLIKPYSKFKLPAVIFTLFPRALNYDGWSSVHNYDVSG